MVLMTYIVQACVKKYSNMTSIKRHTRYYSISLYLAQVGTQQIWLFHVTPTVKLP
jgi:hypothetical protein